MDYIAHYNKLITRAQIRTLSSDIYTENHHILPKCVGGDNDPANIAILTAEEHLCAHLLLTRIYPYDGLMLAVRRMLLPSSDCTTGRSSFNKKYGYWRRACAEHLKQLKWWHKGDTNQRAKECPGNGWEPGMAGEAWNKGLKTGTNPNRKSRKGLPMLDKSKDAESRSGHKGTQWWTNGTKNKRCTSQPGSDWYLGSCIESQGSTGMSWWNNGIESKLCIICPDGYMKGRLKRS